MNVTAQAKARQDLVVATIGGTRLSANHRHSDTLSVLLGCIRDLVVLGPRDRNLSSAAWDALETLHTDYPQAVSVDGDVTVAVAAEVAALVEDVEVLDSLHAVDAGQAAWDALEALVAEADCHIDGEDGIGIYPNVEDDDNDGDFWG